MEVKVTVEDYFSKEELRDIVEDEVRCYVGGMVKDYFKHNSYRDFVEGVARAAYWDAVGQPVGLSRATEPRHVAEAEFDRAVMQVLCGAMALMLSGRLHAMEVDA